jgi:hypothetical protein
MARNIIGSNPLPPLSERSIANAASVSIDEPPLYPHSAGHKVAFAGDEQNHWTQELVRSEPDKFAQSRKVKRLAERSDGRGGWLGQATLQNHAFFLVIQIAKSEQAIFINRDSHQA